MSITHKNFTGPIENIMKNLKLSAQQAMTAMGIPATEQEEYAAMMK